MDFYEVLARRRSIRNYRPDPIPSEVFERLGTAVASAPSACNRQPWKVLIVTEPALLEAIRSACPQRLLVGAPAIGAVLGNAAEAWKRPEGDSIVSVDAAIVMEHLVLAAAAEGLGSCWVCAYDRKKVDAAFGIAAPWSVYALTPLGYPAMPAAALTKKPLAEIFEVIV